MTVSAYVIAHSGGDLALEAVGIGPADVSCSPCGLLGVRVRLPAVYVATQSAIRMAGCDFCETLPVSFFPWCGATLRAGGVSVYRLWVDVCSHCEVRPVRVALGGGVPLCVIIVGVPRCAGLVEWIPSFRRFRSRILRCGRAAGRDLAFRWVGPSCRFQVCNT